MNSQEISEISAPDGMTLEEWRARMSDSELDEIVAATRWHRHSTGTLGIARAIYLRLPEGFQLWDRDKEFVPAHHQELAGALA